MKMENSLAPARPVGRTLPALKLDYVLRYITALVLAVFVIALGLLHNSFLSAANLNVILLQVSTNALLAVGATFVILTGGIDLSVGSIVGLRGVVWALLAPTHGPVAAAIPISGGVFTGAAIGAVNGFLVSIVEMT